MRTFILLLFSSVFTQAQVGIGTNAPESKLDVKGDIKIGNEDRENDQVKPGTLRWNTSKDCFEGRHGKKWKCLRVEENYEEEVIFSAKYHGSHTYGKDGWEDGKSIRVKFTPIRGKERYNANTGDFTVPEDGFYRINARIHLHVTNKNKDPFNGEFGDFIVSIKDKVSPCAHKVFNVYKGDSREYYPSLGTGESTPGEFCMLYLKKGQKFGLSFKTVHTDKMSSSPKENVSVYDVNGNSLYNVTRLKGY